MARCKGATSSALLAALTSLFDTSCHNSPNSNRVRSLIRTTSPELQLFVLELFAHLLVQSASQVAVLDKLCNVLLSDFFLFVPAESPLYDTLYNRTFEFLSFIGTLPEVDVTPVCQLLLHFMEKNSETAGLVRCADVLGQLSVSNLKNTLQALVSLNGLPCICNAINKMTRQKPTEINTSWKVWVTVLGHFLDGDLSNPYLNDTNMLDTIFGLFRNPDTQDYAFSRILRLLKLPITLTNAGLWNLLWSRYIQMFPENLDSVKTSHTELLLKLLDGVQEIALVDTKHKEAFEDSAGFLNIMTLLNLDQSDKHTSALCIAVLKTLHIIFQGSKKNKRIFGRVIGYDQLAQLVLRAEGGRPSLEAMRLLLDMLVDGPFQMSSCATIQNPDVLSVLLSLLVDFDHATQIEFLDKFILVLRQCTLNKSYCCKYDSITMLLRQVERTVHDEDLIVRLCKALELMVTHSVSVRELKQLIRLMRSESGDFRPSILPSILQTISIAARNREGPEFYYDFGDPDSALILPAFERWPFKNGFTFCTWLRVESYLISNSFEPTIFSFSSPDGVGLELVLKDRVPCIRGINHRNDKIVEVPFTDAPLDAKRWYFLSFLDMPHRIGQGEVALAVDAQPRGRMLFKSQKPTSATINLIGSRHLSHGVPIASQQERTSFYGQMGTISIFDGSLSLQQLELIFSQGPGYIGTLNDIDFEKDSSSSLSNKLFMSFTSKAHKGKYCLDNSVEKPKTLQQVAKMHAVIPCVTRSVKDFIGCTEGLKVFFPVLLVLNLPPAPKPTLDESGPAAIDFAIHPELCALVVGLIKDLLYDSVRNQEEMIRCHGGAILAFLLKRISPKYLDVNLVRIIQEMIELSADSAKELFDEIFWVLLMDFQLWIYASVPVQREVITVVTYLFTSNKVSFSVNTWLAIMRTFYWYEKLDQCCLCSNPVYHQITREVSCRPGDNDVHDIRDTIFAHVDSMLDTVTLPSANSLVAYLLNCNDTRQLREVQSFFRKLLLSLRPCFFDNLMALGGCDIFSALLRNSSVEVRQEALHLTSMLFISGLSRGRHIIKNVDITVAIQQTLLAAHGPLTNEIYSALFGFMVGIHSESYVLVTEDMLVVVPHVLVAVLSLLGDSTMALKQKALQDICLLCRRCENREALSTVPGWQLPLINLLDSALHGSEVVQGDDIGVLIELIATLYRHLLIQSFGQRNGWLAIDNALAVLRNFAKNTRFNYQDIVFQIFEQFLFTFKPEMRHLYLGKELTQMLQAITSKKSSPFMINLLNFIEILEDHLVSLPSVLGRASPSPASPKHEEKAKENSVREMHLLHDILEILTWTELLGVSNFATLEQVNLKSADRTLLRRPGGLQRTVLLIGVQLLGQAATLSAGGLTLVNSCIARIQAVLGADSSPATLPRVYFFLSRCLGILKFGPSTDIFNVIFDFMFVALKRCLPDIVAHMPIAGVSLDEFDKWRTAVSQSIELPHSVDARVWQQLQAFFTTQADLYVAEQATITCQMYTQHYSKSDELAVKFIDQTKLDQKELTHKAAEVLASIVDHLVTPEINHMKKISMDIYESNVKAAYMWKRILRDMKSGRGPWGTVEAVVHWKLDKTENYSRMRLKKKRNNNFDRHAGAAFDYDHEPLPQPTPLPPQLVFPPSEKGANNSGGTGTGTEDSGEWDEKSEVGVSLPSQSQDDEEKIIYKAHCELIAPLKVTPGSLSVTSRAIHFREERKDIPTEDKQQAPLKERHWDVETIREVHLRRYLLRNSALEIFFVDQTNVFLNFPQRRNKAIYNKIVDIIKPAKLAYSDSRSPTEILKSSGLTKQWQLRQLSNFDYLMQLNTIAGRSYNDITQYPVFPWVIADYTSEKLDLSDPKIYRDLSKPIGALNPDRLEALLERYRSFDDPIIPPFLYGSHYSSAGIVLFLLIRMEPFTSHFLKLQGGHFDHADRMFDSIPTTWNNCLSSNADVKELTPEFFYLPEFLLNSNDFNLGKKQTGKPLHHVVLPPWAETPEEFVKINREALESEYVSQHLHEWIDLIFGYKQRGEEAVKANNVFYYLTYEGAVNLDKIKDEQQRSATETQIAEFGQTPSQLLTKPHPQRLLLDVQCISVCRTPEQLKAWHVKVSNNPVIFIGVPEANLLAPFLYLGATDHVITVDETRTLGNHRWSTVSDRTHAEAGGPPFVFSADPLLNSHKPIAVPFAPGIVPGPTLFAVSMDGKYIITGGHWDNSFKVTSVETRKQLQSITVHKDIVTCTIIGQDGETLITGSKDTTLMVWDICMHSNTLHIDETPRNILYGHDDEVTCVDVNYELDVAVSGAKDGTCIVHALRQGQFVWARKPTSSPISLIKISPVHGHIAVYSQEHFGLFLFNVNGKILAKISLQERLMDMAISRDGQFLITGGSKETVVVRHLFDLKFAHRYKVTSSICTITMTLEERHMLVGMQDGNLLIISRKSAVRPGKASPGSPGTPRTDRTAASLGLL
eukprot:TRINITY_DN68_c0_g1_i2.p1 TRINITY_DN68_c0_g1~~TRINITY_DN68_c0_g1_i2.p1  ORF type:complete len:2854 (-),score=674.35 TRINITY_DN68_c0_g1_i2:50-7438(-)